MSVCSRILAFISIGVINIIWIGCGVFLIYELNGPHVSSSARQTNYIWAGLDFLCVVLYDLSLWRNWRKVEIAIAIVDATAEFFAATKRIILVSVLYSVVCMAIYVVWFAGIAGIISLNDITASTTSPQGKDFQWSSTVIAMLIVIVITKLWIIFFIHEKTTFITMASASSYYFTSTR